MKTNSEIRKKARDTVYHNYFTLVFVCFIIMILAGTYTTTFNGLKSIVRQDSFVQSEAANVEVDTLTNSNLDVTSQILTLIFKTYNVDEIKVREDITGGIFRTIFEGITHAEQFLFRIAKFIIDLFVTAKKTITLGIIVIVAQLLYRIFVANPLKVGQARVFMESRIYYKTPFRRFLDFCKRKNYLNIVRTVLLTDVYQLLWDFTIVGGIIKRFSYRLVPMILAENPSVKPNEAITLSRRMMKGYKLKLLRMDLVFLVYQILDIITLGIFGIVIANPYYTASIVEFYSEIKKEYIDKKEEKYEYFNDKDLIENTKKLDCYPGVIRKETKKADEMFNYYQKYSLTSLILMFFSFSFIGWLWEVILYLIKDGRFVNRGTMHGPVLPIYGTGCVIILFFLFLPKKFKKITDNPIATFFIVMLLCGTIEYVTSWYLEMTNGMRWWDYTGYFMSLNGRTCLEGLIFFGLGGCMCLYILAPYMQTIISKIPKKIRNVVCVVLVLLFFVDFIYSSFNPNIGAGVTDDFNRNVVTEEKEAI